MAVKAQTRTRGDFVVLHFMRHLAVAESGLAAPFAKAFPFAGRTAEKEFHVDETPTGPGYVTLQFFDFVPSKHLVRINGRELPQWDVPEQKLDSTWFTWTEVIPQGFLQKGRNTITIRCTDEKDRFLVRDVIVHWHEPLL